MLSGEDGSFLPRCCLMMITAMAAMALRSAALQAGGDSRRRQATAWAALGSPRSCITLLIAACSRQAPVPQN